MILKFVYFTLRTKTVRNIEQKIMHVNKNVYIILLQFEIFFNDEVQLNGKWLKKRSRIKNIDESRI